MFTYDKVAGVYWFSTMPREDYQEFHLVGVVSFYSLNSLERDTPDIGTKGWCW